MSLTVRLWGSAAAAATIGWAVKVTLGLKDPIFDAAAILAAYGVVYFLLTWVGEVDECRRLLNRFLPAPCGLRASAVKMQLSLDLSGHRRKSRSRVRLRLCASRVKTQPFRSRNASSISRFASAVGTHSGSRGGPP